MKVPSVSTILLLVLLTMSVMAPAFAQENARQNWYFKVYLDGREVGFHSFTLIRNNATQELISNASFDIKVLFFNAFRYRHSNIEVWQDTCLRSIESTTENGKEDFAVSGELNGSHFLVRSNQGESRLPECVSSFAYWQPQALKVDKLLNGQTGTYEEVVFSAMGREDFSIMGDAKVFVANRYRLSTSAGDIDIWYAAKDGVWVGLEAQVAGKRTLRYELSDAL